MAPKRKATMDLSTSGLTKTAKTLCVSLVSLEDFWKADKGVESPLTCMDLVDGKLVHSFTYAVAANPNTRLQAAVALGSSFTGGILNHFDKNVVPGGFTYLLDSGNIRRMAFTLFNTEQLEQYSSPTTPYVPALSLLVTDDTHEAEVLLVKDDILSSATACCVIVCNIGSRTQRRCCATFYRKGCDEGEEYDLPDPTLQPDYAYPQISVYSSDVYYLSKKKKKEEEKEEEEEEKEPSTLQMDGKQIADYYYNLCRSKCVTKKWHTIP